MKNSALNFHTLAIAVAAALFALPAGAATDVTWTATPLTASSTSIRTDGTLKYAYARGNYTANGGSCACGLQTGIQCYATSFFEGCYCWVFSSV